MGICMPEPIDSRATLDAFLEAAAAKQAAPGGGSVTALVGALAAAMGEMTLRYSVGKKDLKPFEAELSAGLAALTRARAVLVELLVADQQAFADLSAAKRFPAGSPERAAAFGPALASAIRVPQTIGATGLAILTIIEPLVNKSNIYLLSDLAVCADLAMASIRCAGYSVKVNLPDLSDGVEAKQIAAASADELARGIGMIQRISAAIWKRVEAAQSAS
jgi:methenyltetrahydrofolate cyclohydrolase